MTAFNRVWAMPSADTFSVAPIGAFVRRWLRGVSVDPFARNNQWATYTNDINPNTAAAYHMDAVDFLVMLGEQGVVADVVLFDPPYSPRQVAECYAEAGLTPTMADTQTARFKKEVRTAIRAICRPGSVVLSFGWNTVGMGPLYRTEETLLVCHGGDHNDTICIAERMVERSDAQVDVFAAGEQAVAA
jgi:hypothetical protein